MSDEESKAKLARVAEQVNRMNAMGEKFDLECPYCGSFVGVGATFCCTKLLNAVGVVVEAIEKFSSVQRHLVN